MDEQLRVRTWRKGFGSGFLSRIIEQGTFRRFEGTNTEWQEPTASTVMKTLTSLDSFLVSLGDLRDGEFHDFLHLQVGSPSEHRA